MARLLNFPVRPVYFAPVATNVFLLRHSMFFWVRDKDQKARYLECEVFMIIKRCILLFIISVVLPLHAAQGSTWDWKQVQLFKTTEKDFISSAGKPMNVQITYDNYVLAKQGQIPKLVIYSYYYEIDIDGPNIPVSIFNGPIIMTPEIMVVTMKIGFKNGVVSFYNYEYTLFGDAKAIEQKYLNMVKSSLGEPTRQKEIMKTKFYYFKNKYGLHFKLLGKNLIRIGFEMHESY